MKVAVVVKGSVRDRHGERILVNRVSEFTDAEFKRAEKLGKLHELPEEAAKAFKADRRKTQDEPAAKPGGSTTSL